MDTEGRAQEMMGRGRVEEGNSWGRGTGEVMGGKDSGERKGREELHLLHSRPLIYYHCRGVLNTC